MQQYDVYQLKRGETAVILQLDSFRNYTTRIVAPLIPRSKGKLATSLNPILRFARREWVLATQLMNVVKTGDLALPLGNLADQDYTIKRAVDQLFPGV